jgi:hypothetical protein
MLFTVSCTTGISQEDYDAFNTQLLQTQRELTQAETIVLNLQSELTNIQSKLDDLKANPPVLEVDYLDIGEISKLTYLKMSKKSSGNGTYIIKCQLELTSELPELTNVVDVELYIDDKFITFERWIDISSSGFVSTKPEIVLDTGLRKFVELIKLRIVPSFKVFGA